MFSIYEAIQLNKPDRVEELVREGVDVNKKDASGRTPLDYCVLTKGVNFPIPERNRLHIAGILLSNKADPNITDKSGWSAIHACAWNDDLPLLIMCVRNGGSVTTPNCRGELPVQLASIQGYAEVVEYLETQSCDIKAQCRSVIRKAMGKQVHKIKLLPLPQSLKLFVNHCLPYDGWECTVVPESPWKPDELFMANKDELMEFIKENASSEFIEEKRVENMTTFGDLVEAFQSLYFWESFKSVNYEEPLPRLPRYSLNPTQVEPPGIYNVPTAYR